MTTLNRYENFRNHKSANVKNVKCNGSEEPRPIELVAAM